jgi:diguanylate cyclase (GGDEF)-like protein
VSADVSFCAATVLADGGLLNVPDMRDSDEWRSHPLVTGPPFLRFYAGAAIVVQDQPIGVVCVFGDEPRALGEQEEQALVALARQASAHLELRQRNTDLRELAVTDALTGLANRTLLFDRLELAIAQRRRGGAHVGVLYCDVDDFKRFNDRWGHAVGDRILCEIADRLRKATRDTDTVARFSGDEFVVVCPGLETRRELDVLVERIQQVAYTHDRFGGPERPGLTIGAVLLDAGETASDVLRRADEAWYRGKADKPPALTPR